MLNTETLGSGPDLVFLHGLFGAGDNWKSIARSLSDHYRIHLIDLPNHGRSAWVNDPSYPAIANIVEHWIDQQDITSYRLLGHSMGGKIAMQMALNAHAQRIEKLIVVDIAPKFYPPHHQDIFKALNTIDLNLYQDRQSVEAQLAPWVEDQGIRQFLLKSLYKKDGVLNWRFNYPILEQHYDEIAQAPTMNEPFRQPTLFIKGMNSQYISAEDQPQINALFPYAQAKLIEGAGHWPHAEKPNVFLKIIEKFLN
ncbi:alpha/beta fold hydrolase [Reinekea sp.]|jgi:esterase|uniref:alpha/beta fold hydrolase n=1 Tax=Reinekea sp. TaxID=1970455 RepID=UPI0039893D21